MGNFINEMRSKAREVFVASEIESLRAQVAELRAENERLVREVVDRNRRAFEGDKAKAAMDSSYELYEKLEDERDELKRQRDEYKADAERYRHIREKFHPYHRHSLIWYLPRAMTLTKESLDIAVDAARSWEEQSCNTPKPT